MGWSSQGLLQQRLDQAASSERYHRSVVRYKDLAVKDLLDILRTCGPLDMVKFKRAQEKDRGLPRKTIHLGLRHEHA